MSLYINNNPIKPILIPYMNTFIQSLYRTTYNTNKDIYIDIKLPGYHNEEVSDVFIHQNGRLSIHDDLNIKGNRIMLGIYALYTSYLDLAESTLSNKQVKYILNTYSDDAMNNNNITETYTNIINNDTMNNNTVNNNHITETHTNIINNDVITEIYTKIMKDYNIKDQIVYQDNTVTFQNLIVFRMRKYMSLMYDAEHKQVIKFQNEHVGSQLQNSVFRYNVHPYGYKHHMTEVRTIAELQAHLEKSDKDIYINGDITIDIFLDDVIHLLREIKPESFATWAIGPQCRVLQSLFNGYKGEPHIFNWNVEHLQNCVALFKRSHVINLLRMCFYSCKDAEDMFMLCVKLEHAPQFYSLEDCTKMFSNCRLLEDVESSIINTEYIMALYNMFDRCNSLKQAFNNCVFNQLNVYTMNVFDNCHSLQNVFNNCKFNFKNLSLENIIENCPSLKSAFNGCEFNGDSIIQRNTIVNSGIEYLYNNCKFNVKRYKQCNMINYGNVIDGNFLNDTFIGKKYPMSVDKLFELYQNIESCASVKHNMTVDIRDHKEQYMLEMCKNISKQREVVFVRKISNDGCYDDVDIQSQFNPIVVKRKKHMVLSFDNNGEFVVLTNKK